MDEAIFPYEIFEILLQKCDAKTLIVCEKVCMEWNILINKLDKKYKLWEKRAAIDLPQRDYLCMKNKLFVSFDSRIQNQIIVKNWVSINDSFKNLSILKEIVFKDILSRVTCSAISGGFFICGTDQGTLLAVDIYGSIKYMWQRYSNAVLNIHLFNDQTIDEKYMTDDSFGHKYLIVNFKSHLVLLFLDNGFCDTDVMFRDVVFSSFYDNYIALLDNSGYLRIKQIIPKEKNISTLHVKSKKFYSPTNIYALDIWDNNLTYIKNSGQTFRSNYNSMELSTTDYMWQVPNFDKTGKLWIIHNEAVFYLYGSEIKLFYEQKNSEEKGLSVFNTMQLISGIPTCIYMYLNILFIGTDNGMLFVYCISDWKDFKIDRYITKIKVRGKNINSVDIQELEQSRIICVGHQDGITIIAESLDYELNT